MDAIGGESDCRRALQTKQVFAIVLVFIVVVLLIAIIRYVQCFMINPEPYPTDTPDAALCIRGADFSVLIVIGVLIFFFSVGNYFTGVHAAESATARTVWYVLFFVALGATLIYSAIYYCRSMSDNSSCRNQFTIKITYLKVIFLMCLFLIVSTFIMSLISSETALSKCKESVG